MTSNPEIMYPAIEWVNQGEIDGNDRRWKGVAVGFEFDIRYQWSGDWKGSWTVIVNHGAIQTGHGPHGYLFDSAEEGMQAAYTEMKRRIDLRVRDAGEVMKKYVRLPARRDIAEKHVNFLLRRWDPFTLLSDEVAGYMDALKFVRAVDSDGEPVTQHEHFGNAPPPDEPQDPTTGMD